MRRASAVAAGALVSVVYMASASALVFVSIWNLDHSLMHDEITVKIAR